MGLDSKLLTLITSFDTHTLVPLQSTRSDIEVSCICHIFARCKVVGGPSTSEVGGSSAKEAAVGDSPDIDWDSFEKTPPVSVVEEGDIDAIELDVV